MPPVGHQLGGKFCWLQSSSNGTKGRGAKSPVKELICFDKSSCCCNALPAFTPPPMCNFSFVKQLCDLRCARDLKQITENGFCCSYTEVHSSHQQFPGVGPGWEGLCGSVVRKGPIPSNDSAGTSAAHLRPDERLSTIGCGDGETALCAQKIHGGNAPLCARGQPWPSPAACVLQGAG